MLTPLSSPTFDLKWPRSTELVALTFHLQPLQDTTVFPQYTTGLHAWFLDQVRQNDPKLSQTLHDEQQEKAFALTGFEGVIGTAGHKLELYANQTYHWTVSVFSKPTVGWLARWLTAIPTHLELHNVSLKIFQVEFAQVPTTYKQLFQSPIHKTIALSFISPTSFRRKGHHFPLPLPFNVFHSYLRRWNSFSNNPFDSDTFLAWVDDNVLVLRHQLRSVKVAAGKKGSVTGFTGGVEYGLAPQARDRPDFVQLLFTLASFAPYCGTGHKTPFGLGHTREGWLLESDIQTTTEYLLAQRIEQVTDILMSHQKRTGGERGLQVCQTRATILARQEFGESFKDIAREMEIPYETVKTYAKLARKLLKSANFFNI